jgi:hypothetical protein
MSLLTKSINLKWITGAGMSNLSSQYRILCGKDIEISMDNGLFIVEDKLELGKIVEPGHISVTFRLLVN